MTKKAAIEMEKIAAIAIVLVVIVVVIVGFTSNWGSGEDTVSDLMDYEEDDECESGFKHPVTGECLGLLLFSPKIFDSIVRRRKVR